MEYNQEYWDIWNICKCREPSSLYYSSEEDTYVHIYRHIVIYAVVAIVYSKLNAVYDCNRTTDPKRKVQKKKRRTAIFWVKKRYINCS